MNPNSAVQLCMQQHAKQIDINIGVCLLGVTGFVCTD